MSRLLDLIGSFLKEKLSHERLFVLYNFLGCYKDFILLILNINPVSSIGFSITLLSCYIREIVLHEIFLHFLIC